MFLLNRRKRVLVIGLGVVLLLICVAIVFVIDTHFSLNPWSDGNVEALWYFLIGCILLPGALRRYRAGRQGEQKVPWYRRLDLILCLIGLVFGLVFALSVVQKWVESVLMSTNFPIISTGDLTALAIAWIVITLCWVALVVLLFFQMFKQIKSRKTTSP